MAQSALGAGVALHGSQACQLSTRCMGEVQLSEDGDDGDVKSPSEGGGLIDKLGSSAPLAVSSTVGPAINYYT